MKSRVVRIWICCRDAAYHFASAPTGERPERLGRGTLALTSRVAYYGWLLQASYSNTSMPVEEASEPAGGLRRNGRLSTRKRSGEHAFGIIRCPLGLPFGQEDWCPGIIVGRFHFRA